MKYLNSEKALHLEVNNYQTYNTSVSNILINKK